MVIIDLLVLICFTAVVDGLNLTIVERVTHKENPHTIEGVSGCIYISVTVVMHMLHIYFFKGSEKHNQALHLHLSVNS